MAILPLASNVLVSLRCGGALACEGSTLEVGVAEGSTGGSWAWAAAAWA